MIFKIFITFFLVFLNGFFVAAEFAIVKVRYSQIQLKADQGNRLAKISQHIINHLDTYLSATQLGITLASLGLGWIGEPVVASMITGIFHSLNITLSEEATHAIALPTAFILITSLHIIFGELAPKSIAIRKPEPTTLFIAIPLNIFYMVFRPFIWFMNSISNFFLRIIGIQPVGDHEIHSSDELRLLVKQSKEGGELEAENYEIIKNAFDFTDHIAREIMVPRQQVFAIDVETPSREAIEKIIENAYSRVPVYQSSLDNIIGILLTKDLLQKFYRNPDVKIQDMLQPVYYMIETKRISEVLKGFQQKHTHMAVIIDEFGGTEGIITLEDILEELVGEIQDEDDEEKPIVEVKDNKTYIVQSTHSISDINEMLPRKFDLNNNYSTLSGLILYHVNRIPKENDKIVIENYEILITKVISRRIQTVQLTDVFDYENTGESDPQ